MAGDAQEEWIVIGKITAAHGVRGEVKATLFLDDAEFVGDLASLFIEGRPRREIGLKHARLQPGRAILRLEGINDRTEAELLRGRELAIPLAWLPALEEEDEYYVAEIVGLSVKTTEGDWLGTIAEVMFTGANEVYVIRGGPSGEILLPAIQSVVQRVDLAAGEMQVTLPEGLLD